MTRKKIIFSFLLLSVSFSFSSFCPADPLPPKMTDSGVLFSYEGPEAQKVSLGGEFNGWDMEKNILMKNAMAGVWTTTVQLQEGRYEYKFIVDGEWMSGANLAVEVKKDKQGKLYIPEPKAGPNTSYSTKIRFGGNVIGIMNHRYYGDENRYRLDKPRFHIDLDWDVTITKELNAFIRTELDSFETNALTSNLFKTHLDWANEYFALRIFNNEKNIQFDNPLRITDKLVALRYDTLEFFDEPNPQRALGQKGQGLTFLSSPLGWFDIEGFYLDKSNVDRILNPIDGSADTFPEDDWGARIKRNFGELFGIGLTYAGATGLKWPYADSNVFFPDPTTLQGRTMNNAIRFTNLADGIAPEYFKGWRDQFNGAADFRFRALPGFWIFGEYLIRNEKLSTVRRNNRTGADLSSDASWKLYDQNRGLFGWKLHLAEVLSMEASWARKETSLGSIYHTGQTSEFNSKGNTYSGKVRIDTDKFSFGVGLSQEKNDPFGGSSAGDSIYVDAGAFPALKQFRFFNYNSVVSSAPTLLMEGDVNFQPYFRLDFGDRLKGKLFGNFHTFTVRPTSTISGTTQSNAFLSASAKIRNYEAIAEYSAKVYGRLFFEGSSRYSQYADLDIANASGQFWSTYTALVYKLKKNIFLRLGWGVDPQGFDEDLKEDFDLREQFLYNRYTDAVARGQNMSQAIVSSERDLELEKRISFRLEVGF